MPYTESPPAAGEPAPRWKLDHGQLIRAGEPLLTLIRARWGEDCTPAATLDALTRRIVDLLNAEGIEA